MSDRPSSERRLSGWKKGLLALGALVIALGMILVVIDFVGRSALQTQLDIIRAAGDPLTFEELEARREPLSNDRNGALVLLRLINQPTATSGPQTPPATKALPYVGAGILPPLGESYSAAMVAAVHAYVTANADSLGELNQMLRYPRGRFKHDVTLAFLSQIRGTAKTKGEEALALALDGRIDDAVRSALVMLNIGATLEDRGPLMPMMVYVADTVLAAHTVERALSLGVCSDAVLQEAGQALKRHEQSQGLLWALCSERAVQGAMFDAMRGGAAPVAATQIVPPVGALPFFLHGWNMADQAQSFAVLNRLVVFAKTSPVDLAMLDAIEQQTASTSKVYTTTEIGAPSLIHSVRLWVRHIAELRCTVVALAVERFRLRHDTWPESLAALAPDFLDAVPADPFDGQPLRYKLTERGVTVYSVGEDKVDNGAVVERPDGRRAPDLGFRLLRPDLRVVRIRENADTQPSDANSSSG